LYAACKVNPYPPNGAGVCLFLYTLRGWSSGKNYIFAPYFLNIVARNRDGTLQLCKEYPSEKLEILMRTSGKCFYLGMAGAGGLVLVIILVILVWVAPFDYKLVHIVNPESISREDVFNFRSEQIAVLKDLENKGILLTPQEYASQISNYYTTLIAFLIGLFVLFTIANFFVVRLSSQTEIQVVKKSLEIDMEERARAMEKELHKKINDTVSEMLRDSISFKENVTNALYGRINEDGGILTKSDFDEGVHKIDELEKRMEELEKKIEEGIEEKLDGELAIE
jgi:polyhydroxyalkanoate synthesis regulator phasin